MIFFTEAINDFGKDNAQLLAEVGQEAIGIIETNIKNYNIDSNFERKKAYLFALDEKQEKQLEDIVDGASKVGHEMMYVDEILFLIPFKKQSPFLIRHSFIP